MSFSPNRGNNAPSAVAKAIELLAKASALVLTFFTFAPIYSVSNPLVERYVDQNYGDQLLAFVGVGWGVLLAILLFSLSSLLMMICANWIILRLE